MSTAATSIPVSSPGLDLRFRGRCDHSRTAVHLGRYPNLAHSADGGVFTHLVGVPVARIAGEAVTCSLVDDLDAACVANGVSFDELLDALRYARATDQV